MQESGWVLRTKYHVLLQSNLLCAAVAPGRKLVVLVDTRKVVAIAVNRFQARDRLPTSWPQ